jgi:HlyD family secretion protein
MRIRHRFFVWTAAVLLVLFAGSWIGDRVEAGRHLQWARATREDLVSEIEISGTLKAVDSSLLAPPPIAHMYDFKISFLAPEGSEVRKGAPVMAFDTTALGRELEEKKAESDSAMTEIEKTRGDLALQKEKDSLALAEAQANLRKVVLKLDVPVDLVGANERRVEEIDREVDQKQVSYLFSKIESSERAARERMAALETQQHRAQGRVEEIQAQVALLAAKAPRDGTVIYVPDWRGDKKKVGDSAWRGDPVVEIPDLSKMIARGEVDEADAGRVSVGQRVRLKLDAHPDDEFRGAVVSIGKTVVRQSPRNPLKILRIEISLDRTDRTKMRPGMRFRGAIETARVKDATLIPLEAVFTTDHGPVAYRRRLGGTNEVPLELGGRNAKFVQVRSGVSPGDRLQVIPAALPGA